MPSIAGPMIHLVFTLGYRQEAKYNCVCLVAFHSVKNKTISPKWSHFCYTPCHQTYTWLQFRLFHNWNLNPVNQNLPISTSLVICLIGSCYPLKESNLAITSPVFCLVEFSCSYSLLLINVFHFIQFLRTSLYLLDWMLLDLWITE